MNPASSKSRAELLRAFAQRELGVSPSGTSISRRSLSVAPLSFSQARVWFIDQLEPGSPLYNIPTALRVHGRLDREALQAALAEIVRRHEALRTTFNIEDVAAVQRIHDPAPVPLPVADISTVPPEQREQEALRLVKEEAQRPFDL